mmetsp:Transcript_10819/g.18950  ORF Transcript_10819/g.18950 Transcript_10819/m.18950 type:complete len:86 (-) Transcript_10819:75-332(-)
MNSNTFLMAFNLQVLKGHVEFVLIMVEIIIPAMRKLMVCSISLNLRPMLSQRNRRKHWFVWLHRCMNHKVMVIMAWWFGLIFFDA